LEAPTSQFSSYNTKEAMTPYLQAPDAGASFPPQQCANIPAHQSAFKEGRGANPLIFPSIFKFKM
jgi:hypothetical protein